MPLDTQPPSSSAAGRELEALAEALPFLSLEVAQCLRLAQFKILPPQFALSTLTPGLGPFLW